MFVIYLRFGFEWIISLHRFLHYLDVSLCMDPLIVSSILWIRLLLQMLMSFLCLRSRMITFYAPHFQFILFWWIKYYGISISQLAIRLLSSSASNKHICSHLFIMNVTFCWKIHIYIRHDTWFMIQTQWYANASASLFLPEETIIVYDTEKYFSKFPSFFSLPSENKRLKEFEYSSNIWNDIASWQRYISK